MRLSLILIAAMSGLAGCTQEARQIGPTVPQTAPVGNADPRIAAYQSNVYQVAQGGRYFLWYGCSSCHAEGAPGHLDLARQDQRRGNGFAQVFDVIAHGHGPSDYANRIPVEQLWQVTAYVRDLPLHYPEKRRRLAADQTAEPTGANWTGPQ